MLPYKTIIKLDSSSRKPKYLQITNELIKNIASGKITPGTKLPGSRILSDLLEVNRRTVISAYDELMAQGWIETKPNKGCFVKESIPEIKPKRLKSEPIKRQRTSTSYSFGKEPTLIDLSSPGRQGNIVIDDGYPDVRLAPLKELSRNFSHILNSSLAGSLLNYRQAYFGDIQLREELARNLSDTRSINVGVENILITRGSLMAFYLLFQTILDPGDTVIVGNPGYNEGYNTIHLAKGNLEYVPVDEEGLDIDRVEELCAKQKIKAVFIIPHHHYPTTVSLSASRRMKLLMLAEKYQFAIIEDDYDYDFHYSSSPILPIASSDLHGSVAYVGSFSKTVAPSLRIGFIVAPSSLIEQISQVSRFIDSHGNIALERAVAQLFKDGEIRRHLKKALKEYRERKRYFCSILEKELGSHLSFKVPEGGLAIWANLKRGINLNTIVTSCARKGLVLPSGKAYSLKDEVPDAVRIGFASMNKKEADEAIALLKSGFEALEL